ncbi:MAG: sulfite exporter TauE/SafE family protein [Dehalococcoidia bacterium]
MDVLEGAALVAAAFAAGAINAVAGGGSLVSFPAIVAAGYGSKVANVTNSVALLPGYLGGSIGYRAEVGRQRRRIIALLPAMLVGAAAGSAILLWTPESAFDAIVPFLILFACGLMAAQDQLGAWARRHHLAALDNDHVPWSLHASTVALGAYGAYFGAGLGILTLAALAILLPDDLQHSNALKGIMSLVINALAVVAFAAFGPVEWDVAAIMAAGALAGGYLGVGVARRLGKKWLRLSVIAYGLVVAGVMLAS